MYAQVDPAKAYQENKDAANQYSDRSYPYIFEFPPGDID